jgi:hypothetical protein
MRRCLVCLRVAQLLRDERERWMSPGVKRFEWCEFDWNYAR